MSDPYIGEIRLFPYSFAPHGWALCAGQVLSIAQNTALYGPASIQYSIQEAARTAGYFTSLVTLSAVTHDELRGALT